GKRSDGVGIVAALVFDKPDVEAYADHFRVEFLRLAEFSKCQLPILAAHGDHAQVGPCRGGVRIHFEDLTKEGLRGIELSGREGLLARQKDGGGIGRSVLPGLQRGSESQYQKRRRARQGQQVRQETFCWSLRRIVGYFGRKRSEQVTERSVVNVSVRSAGH